MIGAAAEREGQVSMGQQKGDEVVNVIACRVGSVRTIRAPYHD